MVLSSVGKIIIFNFIQYGFLDEPKTILEIIAIQVIFSNDVIKFSYLPENWYPGCYFKRLFAKWVEHIKSEYDWRLRVTL